MLERRGFLMLAGGALALAVCDGALAAEEAGEFRKEVAGLLGRRRADWTLSLPPDDPLRIDIGAMQFFLGNLQRHIEGMGGDERDEEILGFFDKAFAATAAEKAAIKTWDGARERLRIQIVPIEYRGQAPELVSRDLTGKVVIAYAVDSPSTYQLVVKDMLKDWGVYADTLHAAAIAGLEGISRDIAVEVQRTDGGSGAYATFRHSDGYAAARLLVPGFMQRVRDMVGENLVVGIPNRDFMVVWTPDFSAHAGFAEQVAKDSETEGHPLTDELFMASANGIRLATTVEMAAQRVR